MAILFSEWIGHEYKTNRIMEFYDLWLSVKPAKVLKMHVHSIQWNLTVFVFPKTCALFPWINPTTGQNNEHWELCREDRVFWGTENCNSWTDQIIATGEKGLNGTQIGHPLRDQSNRFYAVKCLHIRKHLALKWIKEEMDLQSLTYWFSSHLFSCLYMVQYGFMDITDGCSSVDPM